MKQEALHPQASWLYGVVVALAIREGLAQVIPQITSPLHNGETWAITLQIWRLTVFLFVLIRFFLGSVKYFDEIHHDPESSRRYQTKSYGLDFLVGLVHFILFFGWATTIADVRHHELATGLSHFVKIGGVILLYDVVWFAVSWRYDTRREILPWTCINLITVLLCAAVIFPPWPADAVLREQIAIPIVMFISLVDIVGLISNRNLISDAIMAVFSNKQATTSPGGVLGQPTVVDESKPA
jgi:hypothetical protein